MIKIENVSFKYPTREDFALQDVTLHIGKGDFVLLTGSTGCGKSTLLKCLNGIIPHESAGEFRGDIWIGNMNTREHSIRVLAQQVGLVFQNPDEQIFSTRVMDEVAFGLENLCFPREEIRTRAEWALEKVGMKEFKNNSTSALSGGQKQRVALASVLALKPGVLVLDEPISQLDPGGAQEVLSVVKKLSDEGMTIILVEHRIHEVASRADRVIIMDGGKIVLNIPAGKVHEHLDIFKKLGLRTPTRAKPGFVSGLQGEISPARAKMYKRTGKAGIAGRSAPFEKGVLNRKQKLIEIRDLWFSYHQKHAGDPAKCALKGIDLDVYAGEVVGVLGNNGSGKTTLMHHLAGLHKPQRGSVTVAGKNTGRHNAYKLAGTVGIVFQNPSLMLTCDTVYDEVAFGPQNLKIQKEEINKNVMKCLKSMELEDLTAYHPQTLSGGQRLRCAVSAVLSMSPAVILLDEPTSGQDIFHIRKLMELCRELVQQGKAVVFITHDHEIALEYADKVLIMWDGKIAAEGIPEEILNQEALYAEANQSKRPVQSLAF